MHDIEMTEFYRRAVAESRAVAAKVHEAAGSFVDGLARPGDASRIGFDWPNWSHGYRQAADAT